MSSTENQYEMIESQPNTQVALVAERHRHKGTVLEWIGIDYTVPIPEASRTVDGPKEKVLLHNMSGIARPGELLAIMGTSGAGKSTLLDVLSGRLESNLLKGTLTASGVPVDKRSFRKETGYVMQSDALFPLLTVRETIRYAAYLRIQNKTVQEKNETAEDIIKLLRLEKCADTIVGDDDHRGLSGGEKRRVSIAVDIVHFPPVIFLDEPTSGLDSTTALSVIDSLKTLAVQENCTVIMTIHQPSARLFDIIDKVIFLAAGKVTYNGEVNELLPYTNEAGLGEPPIGNPPEVWLDLCDTLQADKKLELITSKFEHGPPSMKSLIEGEVAGDNYANDIFTESLVLMKRALTNILRTPELFLARIGASIFFGILIGTLFLNSDNSMEGLSHQVAYFVFIIAFYYYTSLEALPIFLGEREIFQREYSRGAYRASSYAISTLIVQLPFLLTISVIFNCVTWWLVGLPNLAETFFFNVLCMFTVIVAGHTFATMMSVLVPNPMAGQTAGSGLFSVMFLFSGFFIKKADIPAYWIWLHYMSLFKYAYDSMIVNAFKDHVSNDEMTNNEILHYYSVDGVNRGLGIGVLWGWIIVFRFIFYYRLVSAFSGSRKT